MHFKTTIVIFIITSLNNSLKAETLPFAEDFGILPSEQTYNQIQEYIDSPGLRARPDGGGPSLGEVIVPLPAVSYENFFFIGFLSIACFKVKKQKKLRLRL